MSSNKSKKKKEPIFERDNIEADLKQKEQIQEITNEHKSPSSI